jgi:hypothetical protein
MPDLALLLDEHYPKSLAERLGRRGLDVVAVIAREDLRGRPDEAVLAAATREVRIVVTEDVTTFPAAMAAPPDFRGVVFCDSARFPRTVNALPGLERALQDFMEDPPEIAFGAGFVWWLRSRPE